MTPLHFYFRLSHFSRSAKNAVHILHYTSTSFCFQYWKFCKSYWIFTCFCKQAIRKKMRPPKNFPDFGGAWKNRAVSVLRQNSAGPISDIMFSGCFYTLPAYSRRQPWNDCKIPFYPWCRIRSWSSRRTDLSPEARCRTFSSSAPWWSRSASCCTPFWKDAKNMKDYKNTVRTASSRSAFPRNACIYNRWFGRE